MKTLSLKQPYAELVVSGRKTIELRRWNTKFRGEFLVHASKAADLDAMKRFGFSELPTGCIVGKATLEDVKVYGGEKEHAKDKKRHLASILWGKYGFMLANASRMEPVAVNGKLGFWDFQ